jgi:hypothetical protein
MSFLDDLVSFLEMIEASVKEQPDEATVDVLIRVRPEKKQGFYQMTAGARALRETLTSGEGVELEKKDPDQCSFCGAVKRALSIGQRFCADRSDAEACPLYHMEKDGGEDGSRPV